VSVVLALVVGFVAARLLVHATRDLLRAPVLERQNHRGRAVPTAAGIIAVVAVVLIEAGRSIFGAFGVGQTPASPIRMLVLLACVGFALLGLFDDLVGTQSDQRFRGHLGALVRGRVTTGVVKMLGGAGLAIVLVSAGRGHGDGVRVVADALLVVLAANLCNLFDRAPGRAIKVALLAWLPVALVARDDSIGVAIAPVIGAFAALLADDLRERLMLGDTGAYALGAVIGLAVVAECSPTTRTAVLAVLVACTIASEVLSFSRVIERIGVLRRLDDLGRGG